MLRPFNDIKNFALAASWEAMQVFVPLSRETIKDAPEWNDAEAISRAFEQRLFDYYGRGGYWPIEV